MNHEPPHVPKWESRLAPVMFAASFGYLLVIAGLIHRANEPEVTHFELQLMAGSLLGLWPLFALEATVGFVRRSPAVSTRKALGRLVLVLAMPPARLAWIHPRTNCIWLPGLGWKPPGKVLLRTLEKLFGGPMLIFAFLILPVLGIEYVQHDLIHTNPELALALHVSVAIIWMAFAVEFIVKITAAPSSLLYLKERWLDLAIVLLPTLESALHWVDAAPIARLFRLGRALSPQQIGTMSKTYRLRGVLMKGWRAFLLFEVIARFTGNSPEKRLRKVETQIAELEDQLEELRAYALELKKKMIDLKPPDPVVTEAPGVEA